MEEFRVSLPNRPGELAKLANLLGRKGVNIETTAGIAVGEESVITLVVDDEEEMRNLLRQGDFTFQEREALVVGLADRPGELGKVLDKLGGMGINVESNYLLSKGEGKAQLVLVVDDLEKAREVLS